MNTINKAMDAAKIALMSKPDSAFFTTLCFSLKHSWDTTIPTACTNGTYIKFNPDFFMSLTPEERVFLLIHESCHVAYLHMDRLNERNAQKWNIAADHVINLQLIERNFKMPKMGLADKQYKGMSTEEVYNLLPDAPQENFQMDLEPSETPSEDLQQTVEDILVRAAIQSKIDNDTPGTIPGEIQIFLDSLLKPKLPWNQILQKYLHALIKNDYSFKKFNRRFFPKYYLPTLHSEAVINMAIAIDASGSVSNEEFKRFVTETHSIFKMMKPEKITLLQFDTEVTSITEIHSINELMNTTFVGRGGTDIRPVLDWCNTNKPQLLLVFSDGHFRFHDYTTKVPSIWLIHNNPNFKAPFGKTIHYTT
jgi:predicted metal-dependent peptidase